MPPHVKVLDVDIVDYTGKKLNDDEVQGYVEEMKELVLADNILKHTRTDDAYILRYLHCNKFKVSDAFKHMQEMCDFYLEHREWFSVGGPAKLEDQFPKILKCVLNDTDRTGRKIFYIKLAKVDPSKIQVEDWARTDDIWFEAILDDPDAQTHGVCTIVDIENISWRFIKWFTPGNMRIGGRKADLMPINKLHIHIVGNSMLIHTAIKMFFPFLSSKTKEQVKFHFTDWSSLHEYISPEVLPPEYGGTGPQVDYEKRLDWLRDKTPELVEKLKYRDLDLSVHK